jgi:hypothetical protein
MSESGGGWRVNELADAFSAAISWAISNLGGIRDKVTGGNIQR